MHTKRIKICLIKHIKYMFYSSKKYFITASLEINLFPKIISFKPFHQMECTTSETEMDAML